MKERTGMQAAAENRQISISEISVSGYRAFSEQVEVRISPITLLIGAGNSGKSGVIQLIADLGSALTSGHHPRPHPEPRHPGVEEKQQRRRSRPLPRQGERQRPARIPARTPGRTRRQRDGVHPRGQGSLPGRGRGAANPGERRVRRSPDTGVGRWPGRGATCRRTRQNGRTGMKPPWPKPWLKPPWAKTPGDFCNR